MAENPGVPQPGFEPRVMSLRAWDSEHLPYSQRLRNPRGSWPVEIRQSLSSDIMPATTCKLAVSWVLKDGRPNKREVGGRRDARAPLHLCRPPLVRGH